MAQTALVVLTTLANDADARAFVTALVAARLVACGTLLPGARSIYRWEGQVREEAEVVVLLKTDASKWEALCAAVRERHPYQVPELLALPVEQGLERYLSWLARYRSSPCSTGSASSSGTWYGCRSRTAAHSASHFDASVFSRTTTSASSLTCPSQW